VRPRIRWKRREKQRRAKLTVWYLNIDLTHFFEHLFYFQIQFHYSVCNATTVADIVRRHKSGGTRTRTGTFDNIDNSQCLFFVVGGSSFEWRIGIERALDASRTLVHLCLVYNRIEDHSPNYPMQLVISLSRFQFQPIFGDVIPLAFVLFPAFKALKITS